jgi:hypothetical protein
MNTEEVPGFRSVNPRPTDFAAAERPPLLASLPASLERDEPVRPDPPRLASAEEDFAPHRMEEKPAAARSAGADDIAPPLAALDFGVHVSMRYHARRRAWYDRLHRMMILVIAVGGSAGVAAIYGGLLQEAEYLSVAVAVAGALELAFSLPERARVEDALYRRFNALAADIADARAIGTEQLRAWEARRLLIRADADDRLEVLRRICHNLEAEARDYPPEDHYRVWAWQRLCAQFLSLPPLRPLRSRR